MLKTLLGSRTNASQLLKSVILRNKNTTVDNQEIQYFEAQLKDWWNLNGGLKALHSMNGLRVPFIRDGLIQERKTIKPYDVDPRQSLNEFKILDVGCGGGILTEPLARIGATTTGLDASQELIEMAKRHASLDDSLKDKLSYESSNIETFCRENVDGYDAVVASEVVEHVVSPELFLKSCVECLKPGGSIFITTINKTVASYVGAIILAERVFNLLPVGTHEWGKFVKPSEIQRVLELNNCRTAVVHGMFYNGLTNKWTWTSNTSISYALHAVKY